jgi:hypothetical protein
MVRFAALVLAGLALAGCSPTTQVSGPHPVPPPGWTETTISIPANQDVTTSFSLPPGTPNVWFQVGPAAFHCQSVTVTMGDGSVSPVFTNEDMPANFTRAQSEAPGVPFATVNIQCHGGASASQLVVVPTTTAPGVVTGG